MRVEKDPHWLNTKLYIMNYYCLLLVFFAINIYSDYWNSQSDRHPNLATFMLTNRSWLNPRFKRFKRKAKLLFQVKCSLTRLFRFYATYKFQTSAITLHFTYELKLDLYNVCIITFWQGIIKSVGQIFPDYAVAISVKLTDSP